jgi:hypothetical protein
MFAAGSVKASKWGWDYKGYLSKYDASYALTGGTVGAWSPLTLAPNGLYYALPRSWFKAGGAAANDVLCFKPGKSNNKTNKWEPAQIFLIPGSGGKRPALPSTTPSTSGSGQNRFPSKGVLSHGVISNTTNGFIYFFGWGEPYYIRLRPQLDPDADPLTTTEWDVIAYNSTSPTLNSQWAAYSGGILGQDGHIYVIPCPLLTPASARQKVIRIKPRNTSLNNTNVDIIEAGYHDGTTAAKSFATGFPTAYYGVDINGNPLALPADTTWLASDTPAGISLSNGISHPNGKIYLFGGISKRVYILDPAKWGTTSEIYTSNDLYFPNILTASPEYGWFGGAFTATLEKLRPGQDPNTLKIIFGYGGRVSSTTNETNKVYTASIVFDTQTETFTPLYDAVTNEGITFMPTATGPASESITSSFMNFPNGHIFQSGQTFPTINPDQTNAFGKLIYFKGDELKYLGPQKRNILSIKENQLAYEYNAVAGSAGWASATPGIKSSFGKTILSSVNGACEITSVKGFYPGIKHFSYSEDDADIYDIPSNLSTLPTSLWNAYFNKPR